MLASQPKEIEQAEVQAILGQGVTISPQPKVLIEIDQLANEPRVNAKTIAATITTDPALMAGLFKVVNSPAVGLSKRVDSAEAAINVLGLNQVVNIVKSIAVRQALGGKSVAFEKFWERSGDIAQIAAIIARKQYSICGIPPDQAYMAGLFHDCGLPVLMQRFDDYCRSLVNGTWPELAGEDNRHNTDHCVVGYMVGKHWRLPDLILGAIRHHHEVPAASHPFRTIIALLQTATHIYNVMQKLPVEREWAACAELAVEELGISINGLEEFEEEVAENFTAG
jgi:HD-like signal output (HDOD) protein